MYTYNCNIINIVDGDTVDIDIDLGFDTWKRNLRIRVNGINAPETRTKDLIEKRWGLLSKKRLEELLPVGSKQQVTTIIDKDKFGRILGELYPNSTPVSQTMINEHHAIPYTNDDDEARRLHEANWAILHAKI